MPLFLAVHLCEFGTYVCVSVTFNMAILVCMTEFFFKPLLQQEQKFRSQAFERFVIDPRFVFKHCFVRV